MAVRDDCRFRVEATGHCLFRAIRRSTRPLLWKGRARASDDRPCLPGWKPLVRLGYRSAFMPGAQNRVGCRNACFRECAAIRWHRASVLSRSAADIGGVLDLLAGACESEHAK